MHPEMVRLAVPATKASGCPAARGTVKLSTVKCVPLELTGAAAESLVTWKPPLVALAANSAVDAKAAAFVGQAAVPPPAAPEMLAVPEAKRTG